MSLLDQINQDFKQAMKSKDSATLSTLRMLRSAVKNKQIEQGELSDKDMQSLVKKELKKLRDSLESYQSAGRKEMMEKIRKEMQVLEEYLPAQLEEGKLKEIVQEAVASVGAKTKQDMGKAMGAAMKAVKGRADGSRVRKIVESLLASFVLMLLATPASAAEAIFTDAQLAQGIDIGLRLGRVALVLVAIVSINLILKGAFTYMVSSGRNETQAEAVQSITSGVVGSFVVLALFLVSTVLI